MTGDNAEPNEGTPADDRRRARQAALETANEHGRSLIERYGRDNDRQRYASAGHANAKRGRRP